MTMTQTRSAKNLSSAALELGRVLADRDGMTFRAKGTCMYPTVRAGDVLRIQSRPAAEAQVGDIAVFRRLNYLFGHRVIDKGEADGRAYVVTRPDGTQEGCENPIFDEDLLGVVVSIERSGRTVPLQPRAYKWPMRSYYAWYAALHSALSIRMARWASKLEALQAWGPYKGLAKLWVALRHPRRVYRVRLPMPALGEAVYREVTPEAFDLHQDWRGRPLRRWTLALHLDTEREPAATAIVALGPDGGWGVTELSIRPRYRGVGLESALIRQIDILLQKAGATRATSSTACASEIPPQPLALSGV